MSRRCHVGVAIYNEDDLIEQLGGIVDINISVEIGVAFEKAFLRL